MRNLSPFWIGAVTITCLITGPVAFAQSSVEAEAYAVYSAFINKAITSENDKLLVIKEEMVTRLFESDFLKHEWSGQRLTLLAQETVDDYNVRNQELRELLKSRALSRKFDTKLPYALFTKEEQKAIFGARDTARNKWETFAQKYPGASGYIAFSAVGFNSAMDQALLYVEITCGGGLCGAGNLYVLTKKDMIGELGQWLTILDWIA